MIDVIYFDAWEEYSGNSEGSGRSEKCWLKSGVETGLFKFPKSDDTTEHISEKLASIIAIDLNIPCAKVDIGTYNNRTGSMSYLINNSSTTLLEGLAFINGVFPNYNCDTLYDESKNIYYSFNMIFPIIEKLGFQKEFIEMMIFDALIGNTDRHHSNWAILVSEQNLTDIKFSPLYDNGSSLCCYIKNEDIKSYLGNDKRRINALIDTKSCSRIRIDSKKKKEPTHKEVLEFLNSNYREYCLPMVNNICDNITSEKLIEYLNEFSSDILSDDKKELIKLFLEKKYNRYIKFLWEVNLCLNKTARITFILSGRIPKQGTNIR